MGNEHLIKAQTFCLHHSVEVSFISSLQQYGLIEVKKIDEEEFIDEDELEKLERIVRLHYDLDVNVEGIDVINHLLERMRSMQEEIIELKNRLTFYEQE